MRPLGCFVDNKSPNRPLPELIFTDNDPESTVYSGVSVQADDWEAYMPELVCRLVTLSRPPLQVCFSPVHFLRTPFLLKDLSQGSNPYDSIWRRLPFLVGLSWLPTVSFNFVSEDMIIFKLYKITYLMIFYVRTTCYCDNKLLLYGDIRVWSYPFNFPRSAKAASMKNYSHFSIQG